MWQVDLRESNSASFLCSVPRATIRGGLICPITLEVMKDPVLLSDGHTYGKCPFFFS